MMCAPDGSLRLYQHFVNQNRHYFPHM